MSALSQHLKSLASDLLKTAEVIEALERERDEYKRMAALMTEVIRRDGSVMTYAESVQIEVLENKLPIG